MKTENIWHLNAEEVRIIRQALCDRMSKLNYLMDICVPLSDRMNELNHLMDSSNNAECNKRLMKERILAENLYHDICKED